MRIPTAISFVPQSKSLYSIRRLAKRPAWVQRFGGLAGVAASYHSVCANLQSSVQKWAHHGKPDFTNWYGFVLGLVL
jgi:hypothetical protein